MVVAFNNDIFSTSQALDFLILLFLVFFFGLCSLYLSTICLID